MAKHLFLTALLLNGYILYSQVPDWIWAKNPTGTGTEKCHTVETDNAGNIYIAGSYNSTSLTIGTTVLSNHGNYDIFLAKYDSSGNNIWAINIGGAGEDEAWDIITDNEDNVYITGTFKSTNFDFGSDTTLHNSGTGTLFLAKYDPSGNFLWALNSTGSGREWGRALGVDILNNIYVGGNFVDGNITIADTTLTNQGSFDMFVIKYNSNGEKVWIRHTGGAGLELLRNLTVSPYYKFVYIIGDFTSATVTFDTVTLVNASSSRDNFVMKYNETGSVSWANQITGTDNEYGCFIAVDWKENVYVTGQFESGVCSFDSLQLLNSSSSKEVYLVSYDYYGNVNWVNGMFGENDDIVYSITSDMSNGVYICGWFNSYSLTVGNDVLSTNGGYDIFISKFDFSGNYYWTKQCGNSDNDYAECLISDQTGNLYVTGVFNSSELDFDSITLTNSGSDDIYIGKLAVNTTSLYTYEEAGFTSPFYPNPASETIYTNRISTIRIYSCNGRPVFDSGSDKIDVSGLKNGLYIICIDGRYYKFVKM